MSEWNIRRYNKPTSTTPFPLEYAFHLLGELEKKTVVDLGCGDGLNTVILASLGARVTSVDISDESLLLTRNRARANNVDRNVTTVQSDAADIPVETETADLVLCAAILHHVDSIKTAKQIHRVLKPGGRAVFLEPLMGPALFSALKRYLPKAPHVTDDECPLSLAQVQAVSATVGLHGRNRTFGLTARAVSRAGLGSWQLIKLSHQLDAWLLRAAPIASALASPMVWEAVKSDWKTMTIEQ
jgi:SAM-dependent methyltransferase